jgi:LDH2 family malate/lactate/ureidoglycolate dehydrogenase
MPIGVGQLLKTLRISGPRWTASLVLDRALPADVVGRWPPTVVSPELLSAQLETILRGWGMSEEHAAITAGHMLYADRHGIDSHGCAMLRHYHRGFTAGVLNMTPAIEIVRDSGATALVDGGGGLGHVPADTAMKLAIARAASAGVGAVAVRNSGHFGAAGTYAAMAAAAGQIGLATSAADEPAIVPTRGKEAMLGTNPIAFAAPAERNPPVLLDMATSTVSLGKLLTAWRKGRAVPAGWALDAAGQPVTDGRQAFEHRLLTPLGGSAEMSSHKGYGLAVMADVLSNILSGTPAWQAPPSFHRAVGHFFLAIDPRSFRDGTEFEQDLDGMLDALRATKPIDPNEPVLVPGDPEHRTRAERDREGIPLTRSVVEDLRAVAHDSGVPFILDRTS